MKKLLIFWVFFGSFSLTAMNNKNVKEGTWGRITFKALSSQEEIAHNEICKNIQEQDTETLTNNLEKYSKEFDIKRILNAYPQARNNLLPIHWALMSQSSEPLKILLEYGADPNEPLISEVKTQIKQKPRFFAGWTAMHIAVALQSSKDRLGLLWDYKGDFFKEDGDQWSPFNLAFYYGNKIAANFIEKKYDLVGKKIVHKSCKINLEIFIKEVFKGKYTYSDQMGFCLQNIQEVSNNSIVVLKKAQDNTDNPEDEKDISNHQVIDEQVNEPLVLEKSEDIKITTPPIIKKDSQSNTKKKPVKKNKTKKPATPPSNSQTLKTFITNLYRQAQRDPIIIAPFYAVAAVACYLYLPKILQGFLYR